MRAEAVGDSILIEQMRSADEAFVITNEVDHGESGTVWLLAQSDTGTQYEVVTTPYPPQSEAAVVSVIKPLRACAVISATGDLHWTYVAEKFFRSTPTNGGDLWSVTRLIAAALGRRPIGL